MNLREQFLKSGLITKKQSNKFDAEKKRQEHLQKKDRALQDLAQKNKEKELAEINLKLEEQKQKDKELNKLRDKLLEQREQIFRARQIINTHAQNQKNAEECYFFLENKYIRRVFVTGWQREMLARGLLAIAKPDEQIDDFVIIESQYAKNVLDICSEKIIVLHSEMENFEDATITSLEKET